MGHIADFGGRLHPAIYSWQIVYLQAGKGDTLERDFTMAFQHFIRNAFPAFLNACLQSLSDPLPISMA